jgi:[protein-PII] uridylyltransferase
LRDTGALPLQSTPSKPPGRGLRDEVKARRAALLERLPGDDRERPASAAGMELGALVARNWDAIVRPLLEGAVAERRADMRGRAIEVAAVGGYGRGALALASDLDVRLLVRHERDAAEVADAILYPLWDAGLSVGHQVLVLDGALDVAREDLATATSLLDWRHLVGDLELGTELLARAKAGLFAHGELPRFMARLGEEVTQRHERFGGSVYLLEPDVKNAAGGLRDLDIARWAAAARWGVADLDGLVRIGSLVQREATELAEANELLWRIRNLLHAHAGRRSDRLTFDEQESVAPLLGFGGGGDGVERMMSAYYRAARVISRGLDMIVSRATPVLARRRPKDEDLGDGLRLFDGAVTLADPARLATEPVLALRALRAAAQREAPLLPFARDAIARAASDPGFGERLRADPAASRIFVDLVASRRETKLVRGSALREMHDLGLLIAMIPEFSPVVGRVHHDTYHVYTVDVHSVAAVDRLAALARGELAAEHALASRLAAEVSRPEMLAFATLLHDVGKAIGGKDHSQRGAVMARDILTRLGFAQADVDEACHLVHEHLTMYRLATRRDVDDPATIAETVRAVSGREGLRDLYLLTVVDLSTTSPTSMTSWKARMLDELFLATDRTFAPAFVVDPETREAERLESALAALTHLPSEDDAELAERRDHLLAFIGCMPDRYLLVTPSEAVAATSELVRRHSASGASSSVALLPSAVADVAEVCVVAPDRPGVLASIAAALSAARLDVHEAQVHGSTVGGPALAVDVFSVRVPTEGPLGIERALPRLRRDLDAVATGTVDPESLLRRAPARRDRPGPRIPTTVAVDHRASPTHTVVEVVTLDRPALLFALANALYRLGLSVAVAKIATEGARVTDVFYVTDAVGEKVAPARAGEIEKALLAALDEADARGG